MKRFNVIILVAVLFSFCTATTLLAKKGKNKEPAWLSNPQSKYPDTAYIVTIGEGDSRSRAETQAASSLARIFETKIETEELFTERYEEIIAGGKATAQSSMGLESSISLSASQTLHNIQYGESYTNNLGKVFVVAYIDRLQTAGIYEEKIIAHIKRVQFLIDSYENSNNVLHRYAYISAASVVSTANQVLLEQLNIISSSHKDMIQLGYDHNDLMMKIQEAAQSISFTINIEGDEDNRVTSTLAELLTSKGFIVSDNGLIALKGDVTLEEVELGRKEKFVRWYLTLNMIDADGNSVITHSKQGREGHVNLSEASARAIRTVNEDIYSDFNIKLVRYFDNLISS